MIDIERVETYGWQAAIRGMRNPMNSWDKSDSVFMPDGRWFIGDADLDLMRRLSKAGTDHRKFLRMINVSFDVTAPLYWWKEFDTYKVGTVANSCSTMHKLTDKEFTLDDFSTDKMSYHARDVLKDFISSLNTYRASYLEYKDKLDWYDIIQSLPSSYNQKRTITLNYEVLANIYKSRKNHKLDEWVKFCNWIEKLPYSELITM